MTELILCPIKETMVLPSTCKNKCTYTKAQCNAARKTRGGQMRYCIDCKHYGKVQPCKACIDTDPRERIFWEQRPTDEVILSCRETVTKEQAEDANFSKEINFPVGRPHGRIEATAELPTRKEVWERKQLDLF